MTTQDNPLANPENWPRVNPADITIREAAELVDDGELHYLAHLPGILHHYPSITVEAYWELRVCEHQYLVDYLDQIAKG